MPVMDVHSGAISEFTPSVNAGGPPDGGDGRCELLGPFALFVQAALGLLALLSLVWKRSRESPQRPVQIWFFDVSKQVLGSTMVHVLNVLLSLLSSGSFSIDPPLKHPKRGGESTNGDGDDKKGLNPCSFYLLNLLIDTTLGILILIYILRLTTRLLLLTNSRFLTTGIQSGYYGSPPHYSWWLKQSTIYFFGLIGMKLVVYLIFTIFPFLGKVGDWMLSWTEGDRRLQVFFVMFFFPLVMNAFQYYVIDSFIKDNTTSVGFTQLDGNASPRSSFSSYRPSIDSLSDSGQEDPLKTPRPATSPSPSSGFPNTFPTFSRPGDDSDGSSFQRMDQGEEERRRSGSVPLRTGRKPLAESRSSSMRVLAGSKAGSLGSEGGSVKR